MLEETCHPEKGDFSMKLTVLGSCSGTEPMPGRHQTSVAVEIGDQLYFIDAGENCAYASYLLGIDQQKTAAIFITHTHMDHVGGLPHLLWNFRKLCTLSPEHQARMEGKTIQVHLPDLAVYAGVKAMLLASEGHYETVFRLEPHLLRDGRAYHQDGVSLLAFHNCHLGQPEPGAPWLSYSFLLEAEGKKVLFSGDFRDFSELLPHLDGADLVFLETGHHRAASLCQELKDSGAQVGKVVFYHHGLEILHDFSGELAAAKGILGDQVEFSDDWSVYEL